MEVLLEREADVENWNDDRLDELSRRVEAGFEQAATKAELAAARDEISRHFGLVYKNFESVENQFGRLNDRFDKLLWGVGFVGLTIGLNIVADKV